MISVTPINNQSSFFEQNINLNHGSSDTLLIIPTFTLLTAPITSAHGEKRYVLIMYLSYFKRVNQQTKPLRNEELTIENLIFQFDLNYSKNEKSRGTMKLSEKIMVVFFPNSKITNTAYNQDDKVIDNEVDSEYFGKKVTNITNMPIKLLLPAVDVKKAEVNSLNYSFQSIGEIKSVKHHFTVNSHTNFGSLKFRLLQQPQHLINLKVDFFYNHFHEIEIKNPIIVSTIFRETSGAKLQEKTMLKIIGKPLVTENFIIKLNNIHTTNISPWSITQSFKFDKSALSLQQVLSMTRFFEKHKIFQQDFDLSQTVAISCLDLLEKKPIYKINGIINRLDEQNRNQVIKNNDTALYQFKIPGISSSLPNNNGNQLFPNLYQPFHHLFNFSFNFKTWFDYQINFNFWRESQQTLVGQKNSRVQIQHFSKADADVIYWWKIRKITLSDEAIRDFYINQSFEMADYQNLFVEEAFHV